MKTGSHDFSGISHGVIRVVSVGATIVPVLPTQNFRRCVIIRTQSMSPVFLGGPNVSASNGFPLQSPDGKIWDEIDAPVANAIHAICPGGTATLYILDIFPNLGTF